MFKSIFYVITSRFVKNFVQFRAIQSLTDLPDFSPEKSLNLLSGDPSGKSKSVNQDFVLNNCKNDQYFKKILRIVIF